MPASKAKPVTPAKAKKDTVSKDFAGLSESTPYLVKIQKMLADQAGQAVPFVVVNKVKRVTGVSVKPVDMTLENGQMVTFLVRQDGDVFRVLVNGKDFPMKGDLSADTPQTFKEAIGEIATKIRSGQAAFDKKQAAVKVTIPKEPGAATAKASATNRLKDAQQQEADLDSQIAAKTGERDTLKHRLEQMQQGMAV